MIGNTPRGVSAFLFWASAGFLAYIYAGFPVFLLLRGMLVRRPVVYGDCRPTVSVIISVYNEEQVIARKLENTLALEYPRDQMEIIVASDGSNDRTNELVRECRDSRVRLFEFARQGKNLTLNAAVARSRGEILVFTDADTHVDQAALGHLVAPFSDPEVGGVGPEQQFPTPFPGLLGRFVSGVKRRLKHAESDTWSLTTVEGPLYAMRRSCFRTVPERVNDDLFNALQVTRSGMRLIYAPGARIREITRDASGTEFQRKVRISTRSLTTGWLNRELFNPVRYGYYSVQLLTHKYLRRMIALPLVLLFATSVGLSHHGVIYRLAFLAQVLFHSAALAGWLLRTRRFRFARLLRLPYLFHLETVAGVVALVNLLRGKRYGQWTPLRAVDKQDIRPDAGHAVQRNR